MTAAVDIRPELSRHAWKLLKYLRAHAVDNVLDPWRVECWLEHESGAESIGELLDCGALAIDDADRYVLTGVAT